MNQYRTGVSLLTQQTVLGFTDHPPSPFGAGHLPQCVTEQRGGQQSFAMNRHTQLQFNLGIPPSPANLATHFDPSHPTPVVIEKPVAVGGDGFKAISANRLALAVRLAKRDIKLGRLELMSSNVCAVCNAEEDKRTPSLNSGHCGRYNPDIATPTPQFPACPSSRLELERRFDEPEQPLPYKETQVCSDELHAASPMRSEQSLLGRAGNQRGDDRNSKEVVRLRTELQRQVAFMKQLRELGHGKMMLARRSVVGRKRSEGGRVWMEEVRGEEDKLLQRKEEKMVRDARTIYNLSLQVSSLQKDMQKLKLTDNPSATKRDQAMRRLAAIYRSTLRLLQSYQGPGHSLEPLPPELGLLLQQISLLSHHFGLGGTNHALEMTMKNLQELIEEPEKENMAVSRQQLCKASNNAPQKTVRLKKKSQTRNAKKTSVLFHPQLQLRSVHTRRGRVGPPHFTKQTMSSQRRQQPPRQQRSWQPHHQQPPYSPIKYSPATMFQSSSQLHSSTPLGLPTEEREKENLTEQLAKNRYVEDRSSQDCNAPRGQVGDGQQANIKAATKPATGYRPIIVGKHISDVCEQRVCVANPVRDEERIQVARIGVGSPLNEHRDRPTSLGDEHRMWMESISATLTHQSEQLEALKRFTQKQLSQLQQKLSSTAKTKKKAKEMVSMTESDDGSPKSEDEGSLYSVHDSEQLEGLAERLRELEGEEEVIRQRWCTIAYEDPLLAKPPIVYRTEEKVSGESDVPPPPPAICDEALRRIANYRQRFGHHLQMTGHNTQGGFDPWKLAEKIADELLSELVDQVAGELGDLCDGYVDKLFSNEFTPPTPLKQTIH